jgi:hypothetical protein
LELSGCGIGTRLGADEIVPADGGAGCGILRRANSGGASRAHRSDLTRDVLEGKAFGDAGAYEKVIGKVHFKVNPTGSGEPDDRRSRQSAAR